MGVEIKRPRTIIGRIFQSPVHKQINWRYKPIQPQRANTRANFHNFAIHLNIHPGNVNWQSVSPYQGAIYAAIKAADRPAVENNYPVMPPEVPASYIYPLSFGTQILKVAVCFWAMLGAHSLPYLGAVGVPVELRETIAYLTLNAARSAAADLTAKHGLRPKSWLENLQHIKWDKLTDSLLVTSLSYIVLSQAKKVLHASLDQLAWEWVLTPLSLTLIDGTIQFITRGWRGFSKRTAKYDCFRPLVGDLGATFFMGLTGSSLSGGFTYLFTRKIFAELWTGVVESREKRRQKIEDRYRNLRRIFELEKYNVRDPKAMMAINLVYLTSNKSLGKNSFRGLSRNPPLPAPICPN